MIQFNPGDGELFGHIFTTGILIFLIVCIIVVCYSSKGRR